MARRASGEEPMLARGEEPPALVVRPPGPESRRITAALRRLEAPGVNTAGLDTVVWREALGSNVLDVDGNRFLDLTSGFGAAAVGHRHPAVMAAVERQLGELAHGLGDAAAHPTRMELAAKLAAVAPVADPRVYFAVSGSDAVEVALKTALLATSRPGILAFEPAYHGLTLGALAASSRDAFRRPFLEQLNPHVRRLPFGAAGAELEAELARPEVGAVIVEPIVGREGILPPPDGWLAELAERARRHGVVVVFDEILTGLGRTGKLFAADRFGVEPDLLCCGKALGGGLPIAAVLGRAELMAAWPADGEALHTATFLANPLATAAALEVLELMQAEDLPGRAGKLGDGLCGRIGSWSEEIDAVTDVRGVGLMWGVELASAEAAAAAARRALETGLLVLAAGPEGRVLELLPPLTIGQELLATAVDLLEAAVRG